MRTLLSISLVALLVGAWSPLVSAEEEDSGWGESTEEGGKGESSGEGEGKEEADPWSAPDGAEKPAEGEKTGEGEGAGEGAGEGEGEETSTPTVVSPSNYPTAEIDRPMALPKMMLEPLGEFNLNSIGDTNFVGLTFGAGFGIIDNVEAGLRFPLMMSPEFDVGDMPLYGLYELGPFVDGKLRAAGRLTLMLPLATDFSFLLDAPVKFKLNEMFAAIGGVGLGLKFSGDTIFLLNFDFGTLVQPIEALALQLTFGVHLWMGSGSLTYIPLMFRAQYTLIGDLDAYLEFGFMDLKEAGADWIVFTMGAAYRLPL